MSAVSSSSSWLNPATEFEALYIEERPRVLGFLTSLVPGHAEDLTQETFLRAFRARLSYVPKAPPGAWLIRIARNTAISFTRLKARTEVGLKDVYSQNDPAFEAIEARELLAFKARFLSPRQIAVVRLKYGAGMTEVQAARVLAVNPNTIHTHLVSALKKMRVA